MAAGDLEDLEILLDPMTTALVTQECQVGVIGAGGVFPALVEAAATTVVPNGAALCAAARSVGVPVVHCVAHRRPDGAGSSTNAPLFDLARRSGVDLSPGAATAAVIDEFAVAPSDLVLARLHGVGPMAGTDLDPVLRNLGCTTIVAIGVSLNVGLTNLVMDAVNAGYHVVVPSDAVAGVPEDYAAAVLRNTIAMLATVTTTADILATWR